MGAGLVWSVAGGGSCSFSFGVVEVPDIAPFFPLAGLVEL